MALDFLNGLFLTEFAQNLINFLYISPKSLILNIIILAQILMQIC